MVSLGEVLARSEEWIALEPEKRQRGDRATLGKRSHAATSSDRCRDSANRRMRVRPRQFILSRIDARNGAIGLVPWIARRCGCESPIFRRLHSRRSTCFSSGWMSRTPTFVELSRLVKEPRIACGLKKIDFLRKPSRSRQSRSSGGSWPGSKLSPPRSKKRSACREK